MIAQYLEKWINRTHEHDWKHDWQSGPYENCQPQDIDNAIHRTADLDFVALNDWLRGQVPSSATVYDALSDPVTTVCR